MAFTPDPTLAENARALIDQLSRYAQAGPLPPGVAPQPPQGSPTPPAPVPPPTPAPPPEAGFGAPAEAGGLTVGDILEIPPVLGLVAGVGLLYYVLKKK